MNHVPARAGTRLPQERTPLRARCRRRWPATFTARARTASATLSARARSAGDRGMSTAEYAVGTIAACAFAALLFKIVSSQEVHDMLSAVIDRALKIAG